MSERISFLMSFRARLLLFLTSSLLLAIGIVLVLDKWATTRANELIEEQNTQVTEAFNNSYDDLIHAVSLAMGSLASEKYLYQEIAPDELPRTVETIIIAENDGKVRDSTRPELVGRNLSLPEKQAFEVMQYDPVEGESETHEHAPKTYFAPVPTATGAFWIIIVTTQQAIVGKVEEATETLTGSIRELSNYRLWATAGLLTLALMITVSIGAQFTRPIKDLADAALRVAAGDLDFRVEINRRDELGQLAATFNEMIAGLKSKLELEEKLNQAERAAVIGRLTQAVAHEIRNPLNVINLSVDHVSSKFAPQDEAARTQFTRLLSSLKDEIRRLKHLVNDVLNYGRPAHLGPEEVDVQGIVEETIGLIRPQADEQGVEVKFERVQTPAIVVGDPERLKSCFSNIAINALQAMPSGGSLLARVSRTNDSVEVSIADTGVGISQEAINKIFEPYFSTKKTGFGLGLAVTKKIVEEHHGSITVSSDQNRGSTFVVRLPLRG